MMCIQTHAANMESCNEEYHLQLSQRSVFCLRMRHSTWYCARCVLHSTFREQIVLVVLCVSDQNVLRTHEEIITLRTYS